MDSSQYIKLLALMATTLLGDVLPEGDLDLNSKENPAEGVVLDHDGDVGVVDVVLVLMEGILGGLHLEEGPGVNSLRLQA